MDLRQLRYFAKVVECGSFSKAANQLHIAQPALSQHVRHMEEELGIILLHRAASGVRATEAGERLMVHAKRILAEFAEITDSVRGETIAPRGVVRFGMPGTVSERMAAALIESAKVRYPEISIRVVEAMSGYVLDWLKKGDVDLAMIYATADPRGLAVHHALSEEICLFASPGQASDAGLGGGPISLNDAANLPLVMPGTSHGLRQLFDDVAKSQSITINPHIEIESYGLIKELVSRGLGFGVLPKTAVQKENLAGTFRVWSFDQRITRRIYLAYSTDRPLPKAPRAVAQLSWETLRQLVRDGAWTADLSHERNTPKLFG